METMSLDEVSKVLKISKGTARNRLSKGLPMPPSFKVGRSRLFLTTAFDFWMEQQANSIKSLHQ
jgi:excisionase family DNA binding protein